MVDIRVSDGVPPTTNERLADRGIRHATFVQRRASGVAKKAISALEEFLPEIQARLDARLRVIANRQRAPRPGDGTWTTRRYREMIRATNAHLREMAIALERDVREELVDFASIESAWQVAALSQAVPFTYGFVSPSPAILRAVVVDEPVTGRVLAQWFRGLADGAGREADRLVRMGMLAGDSNQAIARSMRHLWEERTPADVERIVRTATNAVSNGARDAVFRENTDVVKGWVFTATLDDRTCPICGRLDGQDFPIGSGPRPPRHPGCRCIANPVTKSWRELGIPLNEPEPGFRASQDGLVPDKVTFPQWLRRQDRQTQEAVLGVKKARAWRGNRIKFRKFATDQRVLTNDELVAMEPDIFGKRR